MNVHNGIQTTRNYSTLISPRGARERVYSKRQQFEDLIQGDKDIVKDKLKTLVQPYHKTAVYENYRQAEPITYMPPKTKNVVRFPSNFDMIPGSEASNKGSVARFEDQKMGRSDNLDDTFTREEKNLVSSASQPIIKSNVMTRYANPYDDDDEEFEQNLKYMYPEPGLRNTFVEGVYNQSLRRKK